jgi:hypothetical protein
MKRNQENHAYMASEHPPNVWPQNLRWGPQSYRHQSCSRQVLGNVRQEQGSHTPALVQVDYPHLPSRRLRFLLGAWAEQGQSFGRTPPIFVDMGLSLYGELKACVAYRRVYYTSIGTGALKTNWFIRSTVHTV